MKLIVGKAKLVSTGDCLSTSWSATKPCPVGTDSPKEERRAYCNRVLVELKALRYARPKECMREHHMVPCASRSV